MSCLIWLCFNPLYNIGKKRTYLSDLPSGAANIIQGSSVDVGSHFPDNQQVQSVEQTTRQLVFRAHVL